MPKTLLEVFTESKKVRSKRRGARSKGSKAEGLLLKSLIAQGYEARRTHLSLFPDIIAWSEDELLLIEVKQRAGNRSGINDALSKFRTSVRLVTKWHQSARILCYLSVNNTWTAYEWIDGMTVEVESIV